ncbi:MAG TPA: Gfo/Idh/MocA family oxidoreductase [Chthoniobacteraceae bacterium]|nr:Gfo/Idh/MocA family oxidoreductase [Chthoniobacteraceae bacterium]
MNRSHPVKVGVVGTGMIAAVHARAMAGAEGLSLCAVTGRNSQRTAAFAAEHGGTAHPSLAALLENAKPDYLVICTPHPTHGEIIRQALAAGVHVLVEKPFTVLAAEARQCLAAAKASGLLIGVNYQMRLRPVRQRMLQLVREGVLGKVVRVTLVSTAWFRSDAYYQSSPWRATWEGEGGGLLMNQAPHDLDFLISLLGLPETVDAALETAGHAIEVEDEATGAMRWENGAAGTFHFSTREAPGRFLLEIAGTRGTATLEGEELSLTRLAEDSADFSRTSTETMKAPAIAETTRWSLADTADRYRLMHENFRDALRGEAALHCSGEEALREVELANAILVSALRQCRVRLPIAPEETQRIHALLKQHRTLSKARSTL